jgi:RecB family exonuclease
MRRPTLSPSKITTFLACPNKYLWTYVDSRGKWYLRAKSYYSFGSTLHKVLERFHDSGDAGVTTVGDALQAYEESWIDAGYSSQEEMQEAFGEGRDIILATLSDERVAERKAKVLAVEKLLKYNMGDFDLVGRIDRIDEHEDGTLEIIDYKSGRSTVTNSEVETDLAMAIYQLLIARTFPDKPYRATIHALRSNSTGSAALSRQEIDQLEQDILILGNQILSTSIEDVLPKVKPLCTECDFLALCKKNPDYN